MRCILRLGYSGEYAYDAYFQRTIDLSFVPVVGLELTAYLWANPDSDSDAKLIVNKVAWSVDHFLVDVDYHASVRDEGLGDFESPDELIFLHPDWLDDHLGGLETPISVISQLDHYKEDIVENIARQIKELETQLKLWETKRMDK